MSDDSNEFSFKEVVSFFRNLQTRCCNELGALDPGADFTKDEWQHKDGGGGTTRVIQDGALFEKGGVNFSHVKGNALPKSASSVRTHIAGKPFEAAGVSLVLHPGNPYIPTTHMNVRVFAANPESDSPIWWFGGGFDLTPYYGFDEDCQHWHRTAREACNVLGNGTYRKFKKDCDEYFFIKHRNECRGIGGLFYDDLIAPDFKTAFEFTRAVGEGFLKAYIPIVERRRNCKYSQQQKDFQLYRRGRYVEFNLVYDRGTLFGLQSDGRTESILMSFPPLVQWKYNWHPEPGSEEERLTEYFLKPRDWLEDDPAPVQGKDSIY